jgi:hypothetical protein
MAESLGIALFPIPGHGRPKLKWREPKMPDPSDFDNRQDFLDACIPTVMDENGGDREAAIGQCEGMWDDRKKEGHGVDGLVEIVLDSSDDTVTIDESIFSKENNSNGGHTG